MSLPESEDSELQKATAEIAALRARIDNQDQLLKAQSAKMDQEILRIERERIEYLQNVSHQIVAPLNAMKWHIENLTEMRVSVERAKRVLRSIYSQATLAVHLAKNFRLMSNLESDHTLATLSEPLQEVDLRRLLVNLADDFQPQGWDQNLTIFVDDDHFDKTPSVLAIKPLISQVFSNILENAVKYSNPGTTITATGEHRPAVGMFAVHIKNYGIPLLPNEIPHVFERTYRSAEAKRRYPAGTGFGLYIAKRIVHIHEGEISVKTELGFNIFTVLLTVSGLKGKARLFAK